MANKRVSELAPIVAANLDFADLLLLSDISAHESKKLQLGDLSNFLLLDGRLTGSLLGTASYANFAGTASFALNAFTPSLVPSASFLLYTPGSSNGTASYALIALSSSYSLSSSFAITASYALTSSVELVYSSAFADYARTASYLLFTPGSTNGTASYAMTASYVLNFVPVSASYAQTASVSISSISASYAQTASVSISSISSSYSGYSSRAEDSFIVSSGTNVATLIIQGRTLGGQTVTIESTPAGLTVDHNLFVSNDVYATNFHGNATTATTATTAATASIALSTEVDITSIKNYGIFMAMTQSATSASLDILMVKPSNFSPMTTSVEAWGTAVCQYSAGTLINGAISLIALNLDSGIPVSLDSTPVCMTAKDTTGSLKMPYSLVGQSSLTGSYLVYITASHGITIDLSRTTRFDVNSTSDLITVSPLFIPILYTLPTSQILEASASGVQVFGSASALVANYDSTNITFLSASGISELKYVWTLTNLTSLDCHGNFGLIDIGGMPNSIVTMSVQNCSIDSMDPLDATSVSILKCSGNQLVGLPSLPSTMSYIDCSNNALTALPDPLPYGLTVLLANSNFITAPPVFMPNSLVTMSFGNNANLTSWATNFPTSLGYLSLQNDSNPSLATIPTLPAGMIYVDVSNGALTSATLDAICSTLVSNGLHNGYLATVGNPYGYLPSTIANMNILTTRGWTVDN